jgi:uncharacterized membrane protein
MKPNGFFVAIAVLILVYFILAVVFYPRMPEVMASHWNASGQADGTISRFWGMFLFPFISLGITALLLAVPNIDPLKANIQKFKRYYYGFIAGFLIYFLYVYILTLGWNLGWRFNFSLAIIPVIGLFTVLMGVLISKAKRNFFIGIRTPWTLSSDEVWDRTHNLGGKLFKIAGTFIILLSFIPDIAIYVLLILIVGIVLWLVVYSYLVYRKLEKPHDPPIGR